MSARWRKGSPHSFAGRMRSMMERRKPWRRRWNGSKITPNLCVRRDRGEVFGMVYFARISPKHPDFRPYLRLYRERKIWSNI